MSDSETKALEIVESINDRIVSLGLDERGVVLSFGSTGNAFDIFLEENSIWNSEADSYKDLTEDYVRKTIREIGEALIKLGEAE